MICRPAIITILLLLTFTGYAQQRFLLLRKSGSAKQQYVFYEGEEIRFRIKGEKYYIRDFIQGLGKNEIRLHYHRIPLSEIESIDIRGKKSHNPARSAAVKLIIAGTGLIAIDQINQVFIRDEPAGVSTGVAVTSGVMVGTGVIILWLQQKYFKPGGRNILQIVDPEMAADF